MFSPCRWNFPSHFLSLSPLPPSPATKANTICATTLSTEMIKYDFRFLFLLRPSFHLVGFLSACHVVEYLNFAIVCGDISTMEMSTQGNLLPPENTNFNLSCYDILFLLSVFIVMILIYWLRQFELYSTGLMAGQLPWFLIIFFKRWFFNKTFCQSRSFQI